MSRTRQPAWPGRALRCAGFLRGLRAPVVGRGILLALLLLCCAAGPPPAAGKPADGPAVPRPPEALVLLDGKPLFHIRERVLSFEPADRARTISRRLERLAGDPSRADSIRAVEGENSTDIAAGDTIIMTVTDSDARAEGVARQELARELAEKIRAGISGYRREYGVNAILLGTLYAVLATVLLGVLVALINRNFPRMLQLVESWRGTRIRSIRLQSIEILQEGRIVAIIVETARWLRLLVLLGLLYLYLPLVLSFFPWTRGYAARLFEYLLTPLEKLGSALLDYLPNLFFIGVILFFTHLVIKFTRFFFTEVEKQTVSIPGFFPEWSQPTFKIVRFLIIAFAVVVAFPYLPGSQSPAFKGVSVFLGVLLSLGSTSAVANVVAGVILTYMRAFTLGDRVKIAETVGDVVDRSLLATRVRTIKNVDITIPNALVLGSHITNYSSSAQSYGLILNTSVTIGYDAPWRTVHELLIAAARGTEHILELPEPFVLQTALSDFYVSYELNAYTEQPARMAAIYSQLHQNIQDRFNEAGVEIMSPHFSGVRDGNRAAVPEEYRAAGYAAPAFRVEMNGKPGLQPQAETTRQTVARAVPGGKPALGEDASG